jgi:hypothetical protein
MKLQISRFVKEVKDRYWISDEGRVYTDNGSTLLKEIPHHKGYVKVDLGLKDGTRKRFFVHRLVMLCFNPIDNYSELQVNHINGNKSDNSLNNLEWCTASENIKHAFSNGLFPRRNGEKNSYHILTEDQVLEIIDMLLDGFSLKYIADKYGVSKSTIGAIKYKRNWSYLTKNIEFN